MVKIIQPSFARGEVAPDLYGRVDTRAYQLALKTARNTIVHQYGGISNRPGLMFIGPVKDHSYAPRLVPFRFKSTDTHILEFGDKYMRVIRNDSHVTETAVNITNITKTNPCTVTAAAHGYSEGDEVYITGVSGMVEVDGRRFLVHSPTTNTFELEDQATGTVIDATLFTGYTSGGTVARIYTIITPYAKADLRALHFSQTADVVTIVHPSYPIKELKRTALTSWSLDDIVIAPTINFPTNGANSGGSGTSSYYVVTAVSTEGVESLRGSSTAIRTITGITKASPAVVTVNNVTELSTGDIVYISGVSGMTELNGRQFTVGNPNATNHTFELIDVDSTNYSTYTGGGTAAYCFIIANAPGTGATISWDAVTDADHYRLYRKTSGVYAFLDTTTATSYVDANSISPDTGDTPPTQRNPFVGTDNYPAAVGYYQQRRVFGGTNNNPDTSYFSVTGDTSSFNYSSPVKATDAITATLSSNEINAIKFYVPLNDLLMFTTAMEWAIGTGTTGTRFSDDTYMQNPQSNFGCGDLAPIVVGNTVLFAQETNNSLRSIKYVFANNNYQGSLVSLLVPHFFRNHTIVEWGFKKVPDPMVVMVREDGKVLTLTYNEEQEITAWTSWDTDGFFESVAVVRPSLTAVTEEAYFVVKRIINGNTVRYIERTHDRLFEQVQDCFFVDCGLTYDVPYSIEGISNATPAVITITGHPFVNGDTVDIFDVEWQTSIDSNGSTVTPTDLNGFRYTVANATTNTFTLQDIDTGADIDGSTLGTWLQNGTVRKAVDTITGYWHLPNTAVTVLADGSVVDNITVSSTGKITLPRKFSRVQLGLQYVSDIETLNPEPSPKQTVQAQKKKISFVTVRFERSRGLFIGPTETDLKELKQRSTENYGAPTELLTGDAEITLQPSWNSNGRLFMRQKYPLPLTILAVVPDIEFGDR